MYSGKIAVPPGGGGIRRGKNIALVTRRHNIFVQLQKHQL
jgi:hypothetical protein